MQNNMTSSIFLIKNIDTIIISLEALDLYTIDDLIQESQILKITDLFLFRTHNILKYNSSPEHNKLYYFIILFHAIIQKLSRKYLKNHIKNTLQELSQTRILQPHYSLSTQTYIKRFIVNYRKNIKPYLIGYDKYYDNDWLAKISIINLFILYKLTESYNIYRVFLYLKYNYTNA